MSCLTWFPSSSSSISIYSTQPSLLKHKSHFENLNLCDHDIKEFYKIFDLLDNDHDGYLQYYELLIYLNYETTKFSIHIFDVYDYDKVGKMSFYDFVCIIWNFCTIEKISLGISILSLPHHTSSLLPPPLSLCPPLLRFI